MCKCWAFNSPCCYSAANSKVPLNRQFTYTFSLFSGVVHEEFEEADEEDKEYDSEGHGYHPGVLLLVGVAGPPPRGIQCGPRFLQNLLQHLHGWQSGGGGQDHKGYFT